MTWLQLKTILWKSFIVRKRHWILTLLEIACPIGAILILGVVMKNNKFFHAENITMVPTYVKERFSQEIYKDFVSGNKLFYTPENKFTQQLIRKVQSKLNLAADDIIPFSGKLSFVDYYNATHKQDIPSFKVMFKGVAENKVTHLRYVITPVGSNFVWNTDKLLIENDEYVPNTGSLTYFESGFMALQMAFDTAYLEIVSNKDLPVSLAMQEFPYPRQPGEGTLISRATLCSATAGTLLLAFALVIPAIMKRIVEEKSTGIKELMKMMGMASWMQWLGWFLHAYIINFISISIATYLLRAKIWLNEFALINYCEWSLMLFFLLLYFAAAVTFIFAITVFFYRATAALIVGILAWMLSAMLSVTLLEKYPLMKLNTKLLIALFPNSAIRFGFTAIGVYETRKTTMTWLNMFESADGSNQDVTMGLVFIMLLVDIVMYLLITVYIESIFPGPYGLGAPFYFPITYIYKKLRKTSNRVEIEEELTSNKYCKIEAAPDLKIGIQIKHLYKRYGGLMVVKDFSIDIYEEEITALLGHNGAGKTTTMSIITGMFPASSGTVFINNMDIKSDMSKIRRLLGLCPQHNLHCAELTVLEHLIFFGMLKGLTRKQAKGEGIKLLKRMNLYVKRNSMACKLSGGMQRKLSLGIALAGNSKILILDEPTSGLDPESRREIWDMLLQLRGSRTILITTHFMEEADVLGDRIVIMDHGRLMCYGTSMFLKREYGAGYHLTLYTANQPDANSVQAITSVVQRAVRSAILQSQSGHHLTYLLPYDYKSYFSSMLGELENKKGQLGLTNISISITTLEEVFLKVGQMESTEEGTTGSSSSFVFTTDNTSPKSAGFALVRLQMWALLKKRWYFTKKKWKISVLLVLLLLCLTYLVLSASKPSNNTISRTTNEFDYSLSKYGKTDVFYGGNGAKSVEFKDMTQKYRDLVRAQGSSPEEVNTSVSDVLINKGVENIMYYSSFLIVAAEFNISKANKAIANAMYSNRAYHGAPISLNLLMNAALQSVMGNGYSISAIAVPSNASETPMQDLVFIFMINTSALEWLTFILGIILLATMFLFFPHHERATNVKQLQLMCGVLSASYFLTCYVFDLILYLLSIFILLLSMAVYGLFASVIYVGRKQFGALLAILLSYGLSVIPFMYLFSYKKTIGGGVVLFIVSSLILLAAAIILELLLGVFTFIGENNKIKLFNDIMYGLSVFPAFGVTYTVSKFAKKTLMNHQLSKISPENLEILCYLKMNPCCSGTATQECIDYKRYFGRHEDSITVPVIIMASSSVIYFLILLFIEWNFVRKTLEKLISSGYRQRHKREEIMERRDIQIEMRRISGIPKEEVGQERKSVNAGTEEFLLVHKLEKVFRYRKVLKGVSFAVQPGECFGLLGVNGAGKTTTFRILTGDLPLICGEARILMPKNNIIYLSTQSRKYLKHVGYCPQFDALNEFLTGRQMLRLFAELRGISSGAKDEVNKWISALGLDEYADKECGHYSGGNKRKLSTAMALIAAPPLIMLDEPTSGVDPVSRRKLWDTLAALQNQQSKPSIILTSHSMEECEALCARLAIMKAGQLECCGAIPDLKNQYGQGFSILLKVNPLRSTSADAKQSKDSTPSQSSKVSKNSKSKRQGAIGATRDSLELERLMLAIEQKYKGFCTLKDKHVGLLFYHISDTKKKWSQLFKEIDDLKTYHTIIDDYSITETTLEEVFLSIARGEQSEGGG